jgi:hypothetical protein
MAELCIAAGVDKTLIQRWIDVGRQHAATRQAAVRSTCTSTAPTPRTSPRCCANSQTPPCKPAVLTARPPSTPQGGHADVNVIEIIAAGAGVLGAGAYLRWAVRPVLLAYWVGKQVAVLARVNREGR